MRLERNGISFVNNLATRVWEGESLVLTFKRLENGERECKYRQRLRVVGLSRSILQRGIEEKGAEAVQAGCLASVSADVP